MQITRPLRKPTKQRRMLYQAPDHVRHRLMAAHLSPELRTSHKVRSLPVRTGDTVRVMRGDHHGVEGKINRVDLAKYRVYVEGLTREKVDGTTVFVPVHPSKLMVTRLNLDDKWRKEILQLKKEQHKDLKKALEEPVSKPVQKPKKAEEAKEKVEKKPALREKAQKRKTAPAKKKTTKKKTAEKAQKEKGSEKGESPKQKKVRRAHTASQKAGQEGE